MLEALPRWVQPVVVSYPRDIRLGYEDLMPRVLAALPKDLSFLLLGESFSGPLALRAAALAPPGLQGVVLSATSARNPLGLHLPWLHKCVPTWPFRGLLPLSITRSWLGKHTTPMRRELVQKALTGVLPDVLAHRVKAVLQVDASDALQRCPVPILYLQGVHDWVVPAHNAHDIQAFKAGVEIVRIETGHLVLQSQPERAWAAIQGFLDRILSPEVP